MRIAILIVGSLIWDDRPARMRWRKTRLDVDRAVPVRAPIRYRRCSWTRGNTYTMTIDPLAPPGNALMVPCRATVESPQDLIEEAQSLWAAEQPGADDGAIGADWGCCGLVMREHVPHVAETWASVFRERVKDPVSPVSKSGSLDIPWPEPVAGRGLDVDVVFATATRAAAETPTLEAIAGAWLGQSDRQERYFFENVRHGIRTHEDLEIWRHIKVGDPDWLDAPHYADAVALLSKETDNDTRRLR
jgi:hypothetical protein